MNKGYVKLIDLSLVNMIINNILWSLETGANLLSLLYIYRGYGLCMFITNAYFLLSVFFLTITLVFSVTIVYNSYLISNNHWVMPLMRNKINIYVTTHLYLYTFDNH